MSLRATASHTVGPFFHIGFTWLNTDNLIGPGVKGERVVIQGHISDVDGKPITDAVIEVWQANAEGRYPHPDDPQHKSVEAGFRGFGRIPTDEQGMFRFTTIKPGQEPGPRGAPQAPHLVVSLFMRGLLKRLATRIYFPDHPANASDPVLNLIAAERRGTLIARKVAGDANLLEWNVTLQSQDETVFFDC